MPVPTMRLRGSLPAGTRREVAAGLTATVAALLAMTGTTVTGLVLLGAGPTGGLTSLAAAVVALAVGLAGGAAAGFLGRLLVDRFGGRWSLRWPACGDQVRR
ncbi:hypothetical protein [Modestobacter sp. VKM Ac-2978]|uniref:hypothetical protein n=1 Tax=Modestobacter sp. VKM Ac-2978 TaxID=3004132 RepID=UPI0022AA0FC0|nr:hypothetical protein [Modestobacter sp. VKM Ac-2978]MCZ2849678.1 hypothetical protein [Modestobacter sp. VKM Ac-2978]